MLIFKNKPDTSTPINAYNLNANFNELNNKSTGIDDKIGNLSDLETSNKNNIVGSINSLKDETIFNISSDEVKCDFKYNNKNVYCKEISLIAPNNSTSSMNTGISSNYTIVKMETVGRASNKTTINIPYLSNSQFIRCNIWVSGNTYTYELLSNHDASVYTVYATIYYIKE